MPNIQGANAPSGRPCMNHAACSALLFAGENILHQVFRCSPRTSQWARHSCKQLHDRPTGSTLESSFSTSTLLEGQHTSFTHPWSLRTGSPRRPTEAEKERASDMHSSPSCIKTSHCMFSSGQTVYYWNLIMYIPPWLLLLCEFLKLFWYDIQSYNYVMIWGNFLMYAVDYY